ncbi:carbohydrate-binding protein [Rhodopseudomonas pseudopalustris]|uniref:carbohydrate-binding protein n=1 Tax=Rhodopseudomonas pseudopalustris TaxID=1513892 RepID=UPI0011142D0A|nr:carbohydrate-binding protein [Rhodopseudomonas pseudopalustris]
MVGYPEVYSIAYSYADFSLAQGNSGFPGAQVDDDLAGLQASIENVAAFVQKAIRADGALNNGIVSYDSLSPGLQVAGLAPANAWQAGVSYVAGANVVLLGKLYRSTTAHTSGVFASDLAAGLWLLIAELPAGPPGPSGTGSGDMLRSQNLSDVDDPAAALANIGGVPRSGGALTGPLTLAGDPTVALHAATKRYVDTTVGGAAWRTGSVRLTYQSVAEAGWIMINDGSIGDGASGATTRANGDTWALFALMYALPIGLTLQNSSGSVVARGVSAEADYAAHRRLVLPKTLGRAIGVAGSGAGLTPRAMGAVVGAENHLLTLQEAPSHSHTGGGAGYTDTMDRNTSHSHAYNRPFRGGTADGGGYTWWLQELQVYDTTPANIDHQHYFTYSFTTSESGGGAAHNNMQPTTFLNAEMKL